MLYDHAKVPLDAKRIAFPGFRGCCPGKSPLQPMSRRPNLFIVGAPKCGTTAWYEYLRSHRSIFFPQRKEPHYFCTDFPGKRRFSTEGDYLQLFAQATTEAVVGEASASYLYSQEAAENIRAFAPDAKIIIFVRDRPGLLFSWHNQLLDNGAENRRDFEEAWRLSGKRRADDYGRACKEKSFLDYRSFGYLSDQVERFFAAFPPDQIRLFHFDDWRRAPRPTYIEIMRFLGIADDGRTEFGPINEARTTRWKPLKRMLGTPPMALRALYRPIRQLTGLEPVRVRQLIAHLNSRAGYRGQIGDDLRREIDALYAADDAKLQPRIWRSAANADSPP